jgi:peptide/nickel transport system permease protein
MISFLSFAVIYAAPGDISMMYISSDMSEEQIAAVTAELGLDQSMMEQYIAWAGRAIKGDMGISLANKMSVTPQIVKRLPSTILLMGSSMILSILLAIPLGLLAGYKKNSALDNLISGISYIGMSIPSFWLGMLLIIVFSALLHLLPSSGMHTVNHESTLDTAKHLIMPCVTLSIGHLAVYIRYIRSNTIGQLAEEYVLTAEAKGTSKIRILFRHVLKNTMLPIITLMGMNLASLVCGSFIIESVFGWPGIGSYAMSAIGSRDYPVIMAYVMLSGTLLVVGNFLADLLYAIADPRIKRGGT